MENEMEKFEVNYFGRQLEKDLINLWKCIKNQNIDKKAILVEGRYIKKIVMPVEEYQKMCQRLDKAEEQKGMEQFFREAYEELRKENIILKKIIKKFFEYGTPFVQFTDSKGNLLIEVSDSCSFFNLGKFEGIDLDKKLKEVLENGKQN